MRETSKARSTAHSRLRRLQRKVYRGLQREAEALFGETPAPIRRYEAECRKDFGGRHKVTTKEELVQAIRAADVTFVADYHTYAQAQRTALRLMREAVLPGEKWVLGLELIPSQYQKALDDYQAGKLSVQKFHAKIRYREEWGFPWKNYEPLFAWARAHDVRLIALNRPRELIYRDFAEPEDASSRDLHQRDQWASGIITDLFHADPEIRMLVLYGGLHVAGAHLPKQLSKLSRAFLRKPLSAISVHQNHDALYWKLAKKEHELHAQVVRLKRDSFCVFSGTPWGQLQSLIGSAEGEDVALPDADEDDSEAAPGGTDYLSQMNASGKMIAEFLGLKAGAFESLSVRTLEEADFVDSVRDYFEPEELGLIRRCVDENTRFYLPRVKIAYLASPSFNSAAEFASIHLLRQKTKLGAWYEGGREGFFRLATEAAFGFLGSLVINPRRKCDLPADHLKRIRALKKGERPTFAREAWARRLAYDLQAGERRRAAALAELDKRPSSASVRYATWMAAKYTGRAMAKELYPRLLELEHGGTDFKTWISLFTRRSAFEEGFARLQALAIPASPRKKKAVLKRFKSDAI